ncbi:MAG: S46 family peptidase [Planctomycetes bacterium]|nr:S46 family peptidase [Planctomycetota bacterium]
MRTVPSRVWLATLALLAAPAPSARPALSVRPDEGMWLLNKLPRKLLKETYGFAASSEWVEHIQKSAVRISSGGSGSLVSAKGLVMTNHHVGSDMLDKLSTAEHNYLEHGFFARTLAEEIACPDIEMDILWSIEDVSARVNGAASAAKSSAEANDARRREMTKIEQEAGERTGLKCEMVTLYQGGAYHLYGYKRYTDVRLVMAPEKGIAFFGGDPDNFEFPRYDLDMCFFRIYADGKPLAAEHHLDWSADGTKANELVFVAGHPGRTERLFTVAHLEFLRDVVYPLSLRGLWRREVQLHTFSGRSEENRRIAENDLFGYQNSRKARTGIYQGLQDQRLMDGKRAAEKKLRDAVAANPEWQKQWGDAWQKIEAAEQAYATFYTRYASPGVGRVGLGTLFGVARNLVRCAEEKPKESSARLREYGDSRLPSLELGLFSPAPVHTALEIDSMASALQLLGELLGGNDPSVVKALDGLPPRLRAEQLVLGTKLADVAERRRLYEGGKAAVDACKDPLLALARLFDAENRALRKRYEDQVEAVEREAYAKIAAAQFAVLGDEIYPDATFTLRLAFGTVKGYSENGEAVAPYTDFAGLYAKSAERKNREPWELPERWVEKKAALALDTEYDFVSDCDIIGGNSGSPVVNAKGELVGLIFDGNIQSLVLDIAYEGEQARAVSVDSRAIVESLRKVYDMPGLADEITGKTGS